MLIETNPNKLGDRLLSKEEALLKSFEETDSAIQKFRLDDQDDLKDVEQRMGQPMRHEELIRRVLKANPDLWAEDSISNPNVVGFYRKRIKPVVGLPDKEYVPASFEKGWLPEFSIVFTDAADLPVKEKRGWRTVLYRLLAAGALTWRQVLQIFGDAHGLNTKRWEQLTRRFRN